MSAAPAPFRVKVPDGVLENLMGKRDGWRRSQNRYLLQYDQVDADLDPLLKRLLTKASKVAQEQLIPLCCVLSRHDDEKASSPLHSLRLGQLTLALGADRPMLIGDTAILLLGGTAVHVRAGVPTAVPEQHTKCPPQISVSLYVASRAEARSPPLSAVLASARRPLEPSPALLSFRWARPTTLDEACRPASGLMFDIWKASRDALQAEAEEELPLRKRARRDAEEAAPALGGAAAAAGVPRQRGGGAALPAEWAVDAKVQLDFAGLSPGAQATCLRRLQKLFDGPQQVQNINSYCSSVIKGVGDTFSSELQPLLRDALEAKLEGSGWKLDDLDCSAVAALAGLPQQGALAIVDSLRPAAVSNISAFVAGAARKQSAACPVAAAIRSGWNAAAKAIAETKGEVCSQSLLQVVKMACDQQKPGPFETACAVLSRFPRGFRPPLSTYNNIFKAAGRVGRWQAALELFSQLPEHLTPNRYTYTALFDSVVRGGGPQTTLWALWNDMHRHGIVADQKLMGAMLQGCSEPAVVDELLAELEWQATVPSVELLTSMVGCYQRAGVPTGRTWEILKLARRFELELDCQFLVQVVTALGYANDTGSVVLLLQSARGVYKVAPDVFLYTAAISQCARAGDVGGAEVVISQMRSDGVEPNEHTHCAIIAAYSKGGNLPKAVKYFNRVSKGTALPIEGYCSILSGCRCVLDRQCALHVLDRARKRGPVKSACYTLARQTCALAGDDEGAKQVDEWQRLDGVVTHVPTSTVDDPTTGEKREFEPGSKCEKDLARSVKRMIATLKGAGYDPQLWQYDPQISPEERADRLQYHTEKKALAWALEAYPEGSCITVRKTIRCCVDCHNAFKLASAAYGRTLRILDQVRMHEFSAGRCSCGDWW